MGDLLEKSQEDIWDAGYVVFLDLILYDPSMIELENFLDLCVLFVHSMYVHNNSIKTFKNENRKR